jgi:hypothetical protein
MTVRLKPSEHDGDVRLTLPEGRRLVSGGDRDFEVAGEVHTIEGEDYLFLRVWLQVAQKFRVVVLDANGAIISTVMKRTYRAAVDDIYEELGL